MKPLSMLLGIPLRKVVPDVVVVLGGTFAFFVVLGVAVLAAVKRRNGGVRVR